MSEIFYRLSQAGLIEPVQPTPHTDADSLAARFKWPRLVAPPPFSPADLAAYRTARPTPAQRARLVRPGERAVYWRHQRLGRARAVLCWMPTRRERALRRLAAALSTPETQAKLWTATAALFFAGVALWSLHP